VSRLAVPSRRFRLRAVPAVVTLAALVLGLLSAPPAAAAPALEAFTVTAAKVTVTDGPVAKRTVVLDTDLYVPAGASPASQRPAILMTNGFGLSKSAAEITSMASFLARHGYIVLAYTAAGFGGSTGCISLQSVDFDAKSTSQLITDVLAPRTDVRKDADGPVVGTVGGSYGGGGQLVLAGLDKRVKAAAPGRTWNLLRYSLDPNNRIVPGDPTGFSHELNDQGIFKAQWSSLFFASGNAQPVGGIPPSGGPKGGCSTDPYRAIAVNVPVPFPSPAVVPCLGFIGPVCETFAQVFTFGDSRAVDRTLLDRASGDTFLADVNIPVLLVQGQRDTLFNVNDALASYTDLRRRGAPVSMIWNWGGHGGYDSLPGECEVYGGGTGGAAPGYAGLEDCYLTGKTLAFFDNALRGGPDPQIGFSWQRDWLPYLNGSDGTVAADEQYGSAPAFPAMPSTTFALSGSNALEPPGTSAAPGSASFVNPVGGLPSSYSETSNFTGPNASPRNPLPPTDVPGQSASYTSPPFAADVESVGAPTARLALSHTTTASDLVLFGKVFDVAPDGTAELIHRMVAPVRVPSAALASPVDISLVGFAHRFAAGHSVRLVLSSTDMAYRNSLTLDLITVNSAGSSFSLPLPAGTFASQAQLEPTGNLPTPQPETKVAAAPVRRLPATGLPGALPAAAGLLLALAGLAGRRRRRG